MPLPAEEQSRLEPRVGFSLANVRIHDGDEAHRMTKAVAANAFTAGHHVVFRAGLYQPGTAAGRALLEHEAGHLPEAVADSTHVYRAPRYDADLWPVASTPPPPRSLTVAAFRQQLTSDHTTGASPAITSFAVVGANTPEQEIFLLNLIWHLGRRERWDSYIQLEAEIGWEQPVGTPSSTPAGNGRIATTSVGFIPTGVVRLSIDARGAARAELVRAIVQPGAASLIHEPRAAVVSRLQAEFGILRVEDGGAPWGDSDLRDVLGAFTLLPQADRNVLQGAVLRREATIPPGLAGQFDSGSGSVTATSLTIAVPTLRLANSAFSHTQGVLGPSDAVLPHSFMTIVHEVGHAVAAHARRAAITREHQAFLASNRASAATEAARQQWDAAYQRHRAGTGSADEVRQRQADYDARRAAYLIAQTAATRATAARVATEAPAAQMVALQGAATSAERAFRAALATATIAAGAYNPGQLSESAAYRGAITAMASALEAYRDAASHRGDLVREAAISAAQIQRDSARAALQTQLPLPAALGDFAPVDTALDQWWQALRMQRNADHRPMRVQRFVEFVNANGIIPLTTYARENWPHRPEEFFAETYALWRTDPDFLRQQYPLLLDFFENGTYRR